MSSTSTSTKGKKDTEVETRGYTIPLQRAWIAPRHHRAVRCINMIKEFAFKHMKADDVKIDSKLNEVIWERGMQNPPRRIKVTMEKDEDGIVTVLLPKAEEEEEMPAAEAKEEEKEERKVAEEVTEVRKPEEIFDETHRPGLEAELAEKKPAEAPHTESPMETPAEKPETTEADLAKASGKAAKRKKKGKKE